VRSNVVNLRKQVASNVSNLHEGVEYVKAARYFLFPVLAKGSETVHGRNSFLAGSVVK